MTVLHVIQRDITTLKVDAIVNAANVWLAVGGGVDGAIHNTADKEKLRKACQALGGCPPGEVRVTPGFELPATYIFHAVGPVWRGGDQGEKALLASCYQYSLQLAQELKIKSIAFPCISCGAYGYPLKLAVDCAVSEVAKILDKPTGIQEVFFCCFSDQLTRLYQNALGINNWESTKAGESS